MEFPAATMEGGVGWENQLFAEGGLRGTQGMCPLPMLLEWKWRDGETQMAQSCHTNQGAGDAHLSFHGFHIQCKRKSTGKG